MGEKQFFTNEEVEAEIMRLKASPLVALAKKEEGIRCARRRYMYTLREYERKGQQLAANGVTMASLEALAQEAKNSRRSQVPPRS